MGVLRYAAEFADKRWTGRVEGRWDSAEREVWKRMVGRGRMVELRQAVITVIFLHYNSKMGQWGYWRTY